MDGALPGSLRFGDVGVTRDDLRQRTATRAAQIAGASTVAVVAHASIDTVVSVLAGIEAGVTVVPVSPDAGPLEREHVLADSGARLLLDGERLVELGADTPRRTAAALVLYTSGTTGPPKGVPITTDALRACIAGLAEAWAWTADDTLVHGLPLHHVHGLVLGVLGPLQLGSALVHTVRPTPPGYAAAGGTLYFGVPTVWSRIANDPTSARALSGARLLVSGSAALPATVHEAISRLAGQAPIERYGMTETLITLAARADGPRVRGSVGDPLPGVRTRIVDDSGGEVAGDSIGDLEVTGPGVFAGYLGRDAASREDFTDDGWFRTGDVAQHLPHGHRIVGRASTDLIKTGGYRVGAGEVEDALLTHPAVHEAAVVGETDDDLGQRIVGYVVADGVSEAALITHVAASLSHHKRPRAIRFVAELPRNAMGKVDKARLLR